MKKEMEGKIKQGKQGDKWCRRIKRNKRKPNGEIKESKEEEDGRK